MVMEIEKNNINKFAF